ncbi:MAG TPA: acyl-CoA thioesterase [Clostridiaceae bacterium]|jgi:acyl-CoA hydrolase|nr:acyl-CoA thioesterase [Clostridiaceae bacterium]
MEAKKISDSMIEMRELVLPNDANILGNLLGGRLLHWVDVAGAMAASRHAKSIVATVSIDSVEFKHPVKVGEMILLKARLTWVGRTSMEVLVEVCSENYLSGETIFTNRAYITFVAVDENNKPVPVPGLILETEEEIRENKEAIKRREQRLLRRSASGMPNC